MKESDKKKDSKMLKYFSKSSTGFSHLRKNIGCQDYSACYHDDERTIITACDGHGGDVYIRSHLGSKFASEAVMNVFKRVDKNVFYRHDRTDIINKLRLETLCEWNAMVERSLSERPISAKETEHLSEDDVFKLKIDPAKAYGTTLHGAMVMGNKLFVLSLGDGGAFAFKKGNIYPLLSAEDDEAVGNLTYSLCQEDAFNRLIGEVFDFSAIDGVLLCTDGVLNPYRNLTNFNESFLKPVVGKLLHGEYGEIDGFIEDLGSEIGIGDDVSLSVILKDGVSDKSYKK